MYPPGQGGPGSFGGAFGQVPTGDGSQGGAFGAPPQGSAFGGPPQGGSPFGQGGAYRPTPSNYEFSPQENQVIAGIANATRINGFVQITALVLSIVSSGFVILRVSNMGASVAPVVGTTLVGSVIGALFSIFVATAMFKSSAAFQRVVDTQGNDIPNLIEALTYQRSFFALLKVLMGVVLVVVALGCAAGMAIALTMGGRMSTF
jgi:hypothetical protein